MRTRPHLAAAALAAIACSLAALAVHAKPGDIDPGFGSGGFARERVGPSRDLPSAMALQADGKILVAGTAASATTTDVFVARHNTNGTPDLTFGTRSQVLELVESHAAPPALAVQADGKIVLAYDTLDGHFLHRYLANGTPDPAFGTDGVVLTPPPLPSRVWVRTLAIQADGKFLVGGIINLSFVGQQFVLVRHEANGALDTTFGAGGIAALEMGYTFERGYAVLPLADGRTLVAGHVSNFAFPGPIQWHLAITRVSATGAIDMTFGTNGITTEPIGVFDGGSVGLLRQADGKIVAATVAEISSSARAVAMRFTEEGVRDAIFGVVGLAQGPAAPNGMNGLAVSGGGKFVIASGDQLSRFNADGTIDQPFSGGTTTLVFATQFAIEFATAQAVAVQADDKIVAVGTRVNRGDVAISRVSSTGLMDSSFGVVGGVEADLGNGSRGGWNDLVATAGDGFIAFGMFDDEVQPVSRPAIAAFNASGLLDTTFGTVGWIAPSFGGAGSSSLLHGARRSDGRLLLLGRQNAGAMPTVLARRLSNGLPDPAFGTNGQRTIDIGNGTLISGRVFALANGTILVAGSATNGQPTGLRFARFTEGGNPDTTFGVGGKFGTAACDAANFILQPDGKILAGCRHTLGFLMAVRITANGAIDTGFGDSGTAMISTTPDFDMSIAAIALQPDGAIVLAAMGGPAAPPSTVKDTVLVGRLLANGTPDPAFANGNIARVDMDITSITSVALDAAGNILVAGSSPVSGDPNGATHFTLLRIRSNGVPDGAFGVGGKVVFSEGGTHNSLAGLLVQSNGKVVAVGRSGGASPSGVWTGSPQPLAVMRFVSAGGSAAGDFNANGTGDLLFRNTDGRHAIWLMNGTTIASNAEIFPGGTQWGVAQIADLNGDGRADLVWQNPDGRVTVYLMDGTTATTKQLILPAGGGWSVAQAGDLNADGKADLIFENADGTIAAWLMDGATMTSGTTLLGAGSGWRVSKLGDFDGDGKRDLVWTHTDGRVAIWLMNGLTPTATGQILNGGGWTVTHTADLDGDGKADLVWKHIDGRVAVWLMNGTVMASGAEILNGATGWSVTRTGDFDADGKADLVFEHIDGRVAIFLMNGLTPVTTTQILNAGGGWTVKRIADVDGDGKSDIVWENVDGQVAIWLMNGTTMTSGAGVLPAGTGWVVSPVSQ